MANFLSGNFFFAVDKGKVRPANEDFADARVNAYGQVILIVCDGMGGKNKGDYAAKYIGSHLANDFACMYKLMTSTRQIQKWLYKTINKYNRDVYKKAQEDPAYKSMGTTLSAVVLLGNKIIIAQVGDSRVYRVDKNNKLEQLTKDQTYVQHLVSSNRIDQYTAITHPDRHKLTNAVGVRFNVLVDFSEFEYNNETLLVCSDGLYNNVPNYDIESILKGEDTPERKCYQLIAFGNYNGGSDNMAAIVWESNK